MGEDRNVIFNNSLTDSLRQLPKIKTSVNPKRLGRFRSDRVATNVLISKKNFKKNSI